MRIRAVLHELHCGAGERVVKKHGRRNPVGAFVVGNNRAYAAERGDGKHRSGRYVSAPIAPARQCVYYRAPLGVILAPLHIFDPFLAVADTHIV